MVSPELERLRVPEPDLLEEKRVRHSVVVAQPARPRQSLVRGTEARREVGGSGLDLSTCVVEPLPARWPFPCSLSRTCIIYRRVSNINYSALDTRALSPALRASVSMKIRLPLSEVLPKAARSLPKFTVTREFPIAT